MRLLYPGESHGNYKTKDETQDLDPTRHLDPTLTIRISDMLGFVTENIWKQTLSLCAYLGEGKEGRWGVGGGGGGWSVDIGSGLVVAACVKPYKYLT